MDPVSSSPPAPMLGQVLSGSLMPGEEHGP
jgi:hypothetical protein